MSFPTSPLFSVLSTPLSGRGVFATQDLLPGTPLMKAPNIAINVINREYRKEICAHCFHYDQGRSLPLRENTVGFYFCSGPCLALWQEGTTPIGILAWEAAEKLIQSKSSCRIILDVDGDGDSALPDALAPKPSAADIEAAWGAFEATACFIRQARAGSKLKPHRRALAAALAVPAAPDALSFLLSGVLTASLGVDGEWSSILELEADSTPYASAQALQEHISSYLHLLAVLPPALLTSVTASTLRTIVNRDGHNSFGIRSLDDGGSEFFGFGIWPAASYFNHSCAPNVGKARVGRSWVFWAEKGVQVGEELCISYLGGEEWVLGVGERGERMKGVWGFECACGRCVGEELVGV